MDIYEKEKIIRTKILDVFFTNLGIFVANDIEDVVKAILNIVNTFDVNVENEEELNEMSSIILTSKVNHKYTKIMDLIMEASRKAKQVKESNKTLRDLFLNEI